MRKKSVKVPKVVSIKCTNCGKVSKRNFPEDSSPQFFDCDKCQQRMVTPNACCCIICAYTNKKCPYSLKLEAKTKKIPLR